MLLQSPGSLPLWYGGAIGLQHRCVVPQVWTIPADQPNMGLLIQVQINQDGGCQAGSAVFPGEAHTGLGHFADGGAVQCSREELVVDRSVVTSSLVEEYDFLCER